MGDKPIGLYGRNSASGTYGYFKEHALAKGDFKDTVKEQPGSSSVVQASRATSTRSATAASATSPRTCARSRSRRTTKGSAIEAIPENAYTGKYPLARFLYVYVNQKPGETSTRCAASSWPTSSPAGAGDVVKDGYFPLTPRFVEAA